ncbi:MAG: hypothetical protein K8R23_15940 [Chthoniobacter sp.]|nr:hypothetical protein [Chthoniobacter sp.]
MPLSADAITRLIQDSERSEVMHRAQTTLAVMQTLAAEWTWEVESPAQFAARLTAIGSGGLEQALVDAESAERTAGQMRETAVAAVHRETVRALALARVAWRELPERLVAVAPLGAGGQTLPAIMAEGEEWAAAWEETDPAWVPVPGLTLAFFQSLLAAVATAQREERRLRVRRRRAGAALAVALDAVWELAVRWFAVATAVFPETDASAAAQLRLIPTTYVPRYAAAARQRRAAQVPG